MEAVPLDAFTMRLRTSELAAVAAGLRTTGTMPGAVGPADLAAALRRMPVLDRPPVWELVVRHLGRGKPLEQAAGEIGMDLVHARDLLGRLTDALAAAA